MNNRRKKLIFSLKNLGSPEFPGPFSLTSASFSSGPYVTYARRVQTPTVWPELASAFERPLYCPSNTFVTAVVRPVFGPWRVTAWPAPPHWKPIEPSSVHGGGDGGCVVWRRDFLPSGQWQSRFGMRRRRERALAHRSVGNDRSIRHAIRSRFPIRLRRAVVRQPLHYVAGCPRHKGTGHGAGGGG